MNRLVYILLRDCRWKSQQNGLSYNWIYYRMDRMLLRKGLRHLRFVGWSIDCIFSAQIFLLYCDLEGIVNKGFIDECENPYNDTIIFKSIVNHTFHYWKIETIKKFNIAIKLTVQLSSSGLFDRFKKPKSFRHFQKTFVKSSKIRYNFQNPA